MPQKRINRYTVSNEHACGIGVVHVHGVPAVIFPFVLFLHFMAQPGEMTGSTMRRSGSLCACLRGWTVIIWVRAHTLIAEPGQDRPPWNLFSHARRSMAGRRPPNLPMGVRIPPRMPF